MSAQTHIYIYNILLLYIYICTYIRYCIRHILIIVLLLDGSIVVLTDTDTV